MRSPCARSARLGTDCVRLYFVSFFRIRLTQGERTFKRLGGIVLLDVLVVSERRGRQDVDVNRVELGNRRFRQPRNGVSGLNDFIHVVCADAAIDAISKRIANACLGSRRIDLNDVVTINIRWHVCAERLRVCPSASASVSVVMLVDASAFATWRALISISERLADEDRVGSRE